MTREDRIRAARMRGQFLDGRAADVELLVRDLGGVQAQEPSAAALAIRARTHGVAAGDVERAIAEERTVVRMWAMRGTIHLVSTEDAGWLRELYAPLAMPAQLRRLDQLGVPEADRARAVSVIREALADEGPLTRAALCDRLERAGIDTAGQKAAHLPRLAALEGYVCFGPRRGAKDTYVLADDWIGESWRRAPPDRDRALAELARRYLGAYGPAEPGDFAAWSGLGMRDARAALERIAAEVEHVDGGFVARADRDRIDDPPPDPPLVRLVPSFDTYLLGYADRSLAVPDEHAARVWPGGGIIRATMLENGFASGTWRVDRNATRARVEIEPFGEHVPDAQAEIEDIVRFLGDVA